MACQMRCRPMSASCTQRNIAGALCALVLFFGATWSHAADPKPLTSILLVGGDDLDPVFADSVVLVLNNLGPSPAGVIVNKPTKVAVAELFPEIKRLAQLHDKVYFGGPVELETVWFVFRATAAPKNAIQACEGVYLSGNRDLLLQLLGREHPMEGLRIFIGHSGWGPGQLEDEIAEGAWTLKRAEPAAIFDDKPAHPSTPEGANHST
jgi:putative transcriptional regulator